MQFDSRGVVSVNSISDLGGGCKVVQGIIGQGKSVLLRHLAVQEILREDNARIPLFYELRKLSKSTSLEQGLAQTLTDYDLKVDEEVFSYLASSGRMVLLLDGFDELDSDVIKSTTLEIDRLVVRFPELQIIVSSRPGNEIQKLSSFEIVNISSLRETDYGPFLRKLGLKSDRVFDIVEAIKDSPAKVSELINTPLMLTLVVMVYQSESQIPSELPEFFDKLFYTVFTRHDKLKPAFFRQHYSGLSENKLRSLFEAFCFMCIQFGNGRTLKPREFSEAFNYALECTSGSACSEDGFRKDLVKVSCLMLEEGFDQVTFLHKSIAEYYAAAFVKESDDGFAERFYCEASEEWNQWQECLNFLRVIDSARFAKFYDLKNLGEPIALLKQLISFKSGRECYEILPDWLRALRVFYRRVGPDEGYYVSSFGNWTLPDNMYSAKIGGVLSDSIFKTSENDLSVEDIKQMREDGHHIAQISEFELEIGIASVITLWGGEVIREDAKNLLRDFEGRLSAAETLAQKMAKKPLIFDRKNSAKT
ncbi:NACHT domain-containing protein [Pseudomonas sp. ATCC 13867]|nr:NACHT domain-containing protein [Pseudomonas sp. ATCC 13867]